MAFELSKTTSWYRNDGRGNGYFAPGWDSERIARRTGVFRWIGLALAVAILAIGAFNFNLQYSEQGDYTQLKTNGVLLPATVGPVAVGHSTDRYSIGGQSGWDYITETSAAIEYRIDGQTLQGEINDHRQRKKDYPEPAWTQGETVQVYVDPNEHERFVLFDEYMEEDAHSFPRGALFVLIFTGIVLILPAVLFIAGMRNVRTARKL
ncbi:DUF3592 domain-containing protein [Crystallibacter degradans]|uniref:DUF3592 domain-containing protein n=1 Tax=Crystallibacter degradans TaxID=2726743 RepID=UPI0014758CE6|nr:hypothetical protein [Arthrobacter sp. SF27]